MANGRVARLLLLSLSALLATGAQAVTEPKAPPALPEAQDNSWPRNEIVRFVRARLDKEGLKAAPEAPKATLIRRVYLDLIGLPPTPAEADAFEHDPSPNAYEKIVDRCL